MTEPLPFDRCLEVIERAGTDLARHAATAGLDASVVTCPAWSVSDLLAHQGMVHRWAAANLRLDSTPPPSKTEILRTVPAAQLIGWFGEGLHLLLTTLRAVDPDVPAMVFLRDAPAPRRFWARRQAHETTIHSIDALAGALGRLPTAEQAGVDLDVAVDGIDELLTGFYSRGRSKLAGEEPLTIAVAPPMPTGRGRWPLPTAGSRPSAGASPTRRRP